MRTTPEEEGLIKQWAESDKKLYAEIESLKTAYYTKLRQIQDALKILDEISEGWKDHVLIQNIVTQKDLDRLRLCLANGEMKK